MKEVVSFIMFSIWTLFFVVFLTAFKPDIVTAGPTPTTHGHCSMKVPTSLDLQLTRLCRSDVARCRAAKLTIAVQRIVLQILLDCKVPRGENCLSNPMPHLTGKT